MKLECNIVLVQDIALQVQFVIVDWENSQTRKLIVALCHCVEIRDRISSESRDLVASRIKQRKSSV